jgi:hypothetical protein
MDDAPATSRSHDLSFSVTLSAEPAFADSVGALAARAGDFAGCPADDARRLGDAVREVFARLAGCVPVTEHLAVTVHGDARLVRVDVRCEFAGAQDLEQRIDGDGGPPIRSLVDRVEFGADGASRFCRITQQVRPAR